jgi:hypothetical protein
MIAWERYMREVERAALSTNHRRLAAPSSLHNHLVRHKDRLTPPPRQPTTGGEASERRRG